MQSAAGRFAASLAQHLVHWFSYFRSIPKFTRAFFPLMDRFRTILILARRKTRVLSARVIILCHDWSNRFFALVIWGPPHVCGGMNPFSTRCAFVPHLHHHDYSDDHDPIWLGSPTARNSINSGHRSLRLGFISMFRHGSGALCGFFFRRSLPSTRFAVRPRYFVVGHFHMVEMASRSSFFFGVRLFAARILVRQNDRPHDERNVSGPASFLAHFIVDLLHFIPVRIYRFTLGLVATSGVILRLVN